MGRNCRKAMMKMKTSTSDMLVVAKNSTTPLTLAGRFGNAMRIDPDPITDCKMPSNREAITVPVRLPTPPKIGRAHV